MRCLITGYIVIMVGFYGVLTVQSGNWADDWFRAALVTVLTVLYVRMVWKNPVTAYSDSISNAVLITGMLMTLIGFGSFFFEVPLQLSGVLLWGAFAGCVMMITSKYIREYRFVRGFRR